MPKVAGTRAPRQVTEGIALMKVPVPVLARAAVLGLLLTFLAGCGSSLGAGPAGSASPAAASAAATTSLPAGAKQKFLASETTAIDAIRAGGTRLRKLPVSFTGARLSQILGPMLSATAAFDSQLSALPWPGGSRPLVNSVLAADRAWIAAARRLEATSHLRHEEVAKALAADVVRQVRAVNRLLVATGEPPL
jgi:hypothetical protein